MTVGERTRISLVRAARDKRTGRACHGVSLLAGAARDKKRRRSQPGAGVSRFARSAAERHDGQSKLWPHSTLASESASWKGTTFPELCGHGRSGFSIAILHL